MGLRSEVVEAMAVERLAISLRLAILAVIDEYEEVTLCENRYSPGLWYSEGTAGFDAKFTKNLHTFLRRKPKPDVTELARRAVKAWRSTHGSMVPVCDAMDALEKKLDE